MTTSSVWALSLSRSSTNTPRRLESSSVLIDNGALDCFLSTRAAPKLGLEGRTRMTELELATGQVSNQHSLATQIGVQGSKVKCQVFVDVVERSVGRVQPADWLSSL